MSIQRISTFCYVSQVTTMKGRTRNSENTSINMQYLSSYTSVYLHSSKFVCLFIYQTIYLIISFSLFMFFYVYPSIYLCIHLYIYYSSSPFIYLHIYLYKNTKFCIKYLKNYCLVKIFEKKIIIHLSVNQ